MVDRETFLRWAESRFRNVRESGEEICLNSVFTEDRGHHLWCNPKINAYHCWKTDEGGNLYKLVRLVDRCEQEQAEQTLGYDLSLLLLQEKVRKLFQQKKKKPTVPTLSLPEGCSPILSLPEGSWWRQKAENYLKSRGLSAEGLYVAGDGSFKNRIIIPYYGPSGDLVYFNSRVMGQSRLRYLGPPKEVGAGKSDVLWARSWPGSGKVYLCEGEFDAMSLCECGLDGMACGGKEVSLTQCGLLRGYHVVLAFDQDKSGLAALHKVGGNLLANGVLTVSFVRPPQGVKDWNAMLIRHGEKVVRGYLTAHERLLTPDLMMKLRSVSF